MEVLVGLVLLTMVCIATLSYFAHALGGLNKQGNRRAALERARERLEQLMETAVGDLPALDGDTYWCSIGNPCTEWTRSEISVAQTVAVNDFPNQRIETSVQGVDDPSAGTATLDAWDLSVKVWFTPDLTDDDHHRVYLRTLRAP